MNHTPGPWKSVIASYSEDNLSWLACADVVTPRGATLVRFEGTQDYQKNDEAEANANLIAAAPTMLQALLDIRLSIMMGAGGGVTDTAWIVNSHSETIVERIDGILISLGYDPEKLGDE